MISGFLILDKEKDLTCRKIDNIIQHRFHTKVGHLGTLDPFATGLLIVALGDATKLLPLLKDDFKTYQASLLLGSETETLDSHGELIDSAPIPSLNEDLILKAFETIKNKKTQIPPKYSAKRLDGRRAYDLARENQDFELKPIEIEIRQLKLMNFNKTTIDFEADVSKGCYIRALGRDIALALNTKGHLTELRRTKVGDFTLEKSVLLDDVTEENIISIQDMFSDIPTYEVIDSDIKKAINGTPLHTDFDTDFIFISVNNKLVALYKREKEMYISYRGFRHED